MNDKIELQIGYVFTADDRVVKIAMPFLEQHNDLIAMARETARMIRMTNEKFWASIKEIHPELDEFEASYNHDTKEITVLSRRYK